MKRNIRFAAFLLALLMIVAAMPIALAEGHTHSYSNEFTIDREATCKEPGEKSKHCTVDGCNDRTEITTIPKTDHVFTRWNPIIPATCETPGEQVSNCDNCGTASEPQPISPRGHNWSAWQDDPENRATCKDGGKPGKEIRYCSNPGCEKGGVERRDVPAPSHSWSQYYVQTRPTCSGKGSQYRICSRCQLKETEEVAELGKNQTEGHRFGAWETISKGTCIKKGQQKRKCPDCGREEYRETEFGKHEVNPGEMTVKGKKVKFSWYAKPAPTLERKGRKVQYCKHCKKVMKSQEYAPENYHYDIPVYGFGPMAGSVSTALAGSMERLIPVDLTTPGEKYYALVSQDNKLIGQIIVGVTEGSLSVNYRTSDPATVVKQAMFYFYPSAASMTLQDLNDPTKAYQFGQAIPTGGLTSCVISPRLIVNYDSDNPGNRIFNEAGLYIDGTSNNSMVLQEMTSQLIYGFAPASAPEAPAQAEPAAVEAAPAEAAPPSQQVVVPVIPGN